MKMIVHIIICSLTLCGCAKSGREAADGMAASGGFTAQTFPGETFRLKGWLRPGRGNSPDKILRVYIEGDGRSWDSRTRVSRDPTPGCPVGMALATACSGDGPVLYLARPCQYLAPEDLRRCSPRYWTGARLSPEVIVDLNLAVDAAKSAAGAEKTALYGFSGGGGAAVLLAARRSDVVFIGTAAGLLDHAHWTSLHGVSPLSGSLNPVDEAAKVAAIPQVHLSGGRDSVMPPQIAAEFCRKANARARLDVGRDTCAQVIVDGAGHSGPWQFPELAE